MARCNARYTQQVRCEERKGHSGQHAHSFYARYWDSQPVRLAESESDALYAAVAELEHAEYLAARARLAARSCAA